MMSVRCLCLLLAMCFSLESIGAQDVYEFFPTVPGSLYKLSTEFHTWEYAVTLCQEDGDGAHLVVINSQEEADVVKKLFERITDSAYHWLAVGINDLVQEGTWVTVQGGLVSTSGYNVWKAGEPNSVTGNEDCGTVDRNATYNDYECVYYIPFICEKPNV